MDIEVLALQTAKQLVSTGVTDTTVSLTEDFVLDLWVEGDLQNAVVLMRANPTWQLLITDELNKE